MPASEQRVYGRVQETAPPDFIAIRDFFQERHKAGVAAGESWPVPLLSQWGFDKPSYRRAFGHVFVQLMLRGLQEDPNSPDTPDDRALVSRRIFSDLDMVREGPEGTISPQTRDAIHTEAAHITTTPVLVGRRVLEILRLQGHPALPTADEALLALERQALTEQGTIQNGPLAA